MQSLPTLENIVAETFENINGSLLYRVSKKNAMEIQQAVVHHKRG
jgi:hypothetical protein